MFKNEALENEVYMLIVNVAHKMQNTMPEPDVRII